MRKKCGGSRVKGVRSASPRRLQKGKVSSSRVKSIRKQLQKIKSTRSQYKKTLSSPKNRSRYGKQLQSRMKQLDQKEIKLKRQLPRSKSKSKAKSAPGKISHENAHFKYLLYKKNRTRKPGETEAQFRRRQARRNTSRSQARTHRYSPPSPLVFGEIINPVTKREVPIRV